jgi:Tol biopolymer transport system component/tRNA A-37 threonylcarbamoyl transferase component Bud32
MDLKPGDNLGPYEIVSAIGKGGMGEVWKARDPRLDRIVAIKTSSARFSERFEREARAVAALNHPNIATIHGFERCGDVHYLVMEYVEGVSPAGRYPSDRALHIASQLAAALEAAHAKGIVHRDLKPDNLIVKADGTVKVLDFGLAKMMQPESICADDGTLSMPLTEAGVIMGTVGYMSPEQAGGKPVDKRADIWAFGVILFELLAGHRLFSGSSVQDTLAQVLSRDIDLSRVPAEYRLLLRRCLERNPGHRLRDIGDALPLVGQAPLSHTVAGLRANRPYWRWASVVFALAGLTVGAYHFFEAKATLPVPFRFRIPYPDGVKPAESGTFSVSPNGRMIEYATAGAAGLSLWIQALDSLEPSVLLGAEMKVEEAPRFWSSDSKSLLFFSEGRLKKADLSGGGALTVCESPGLVLGGSSNRDQILFGTLSNSGIMKVAAGGGTPVSVTELDASRKERTHVFPSFLPDGKHFLYLRVSTAIENTGIYVGSLASTPREQPLRRLIATSTGAQFVPGQGATGRILFLRDGTLMAQNFNTASLEVQGEPAPVAKSVGNTRGFPFFAAASGNLIYRSTPALARRMTWFDRSGRQIMQVGDPMILNDPPVLSPSGSQVVVSQYDSIDRINDLWLYTLDPYGSLRLIRGPSLNESPVWSADGRRIAYASYRSGHGDLYQANANGDGQQTPLLESPGDKVPDSWSKDGYLLYAQRRPGTANDLLVLPPAGKPFVFLASPANESAGKFSPDGRSVAYLSDESGTVELYLRSFTPAADSGAAVVGSRIPVSAGGAGAAHWRADGRALFYIARNGNLMEVPFAPGVAKQPGQAISLFPAPLPDHWDATPDGQRFLFAIPVGQQAIAPFSVVLNWQAGLKN